jgi:hypothetical protein
MLPVLGVCCLAAAMVRVLSAMGAGHAEAGGAAKGSGRQRTLYLLPPSASVAERLRVTWEGKECLLAVVGPAQ